jgi:hypothetical protein
VLTDSQVFIAEGPQDFLLRIVVNLVQQQHVGADALDDLGEMLRLRIAACPKSLEHLAGLLAIKRYVEGGKSNGIRRPIRRANADRNQHGGDLQQ